MSEDKKEKPLRKFTNNSMNNIFNKKIENIYDNCEKSNVNTDGFYPYSTDGKWHSGIHIIQEYVYPLMAGKLVAYRNCEVKNGQKDYGANFYMIEHEISDTNIKFCTLYYHIASDEKVLDELTIDGNFVNVYKTMKLPFSKHWKFTVNNFDVEETLLQYDNKNIFQGSWFKSNEKNLTVNNYLNRLEEDNYNLNDITFFSSTSDKLPKLSINEIEIEKYFVEISSYFFSEADLLYSGNVDNKPFLFSNENAVTEFNKKIEKTQNFIRKDINKKSLSEYESLNIIIPCEKIGTSQLKDNEPRNVFYSVRYEDNKEKIYRIKDNVKLNKRSCPLSYVDVTTEIINQLEDHIIMLEQEEFDELLKELDVNIKQLYSSNIINDKYYYILTYNNFSEDKDYLFFYEGYPYFIEYIDVDKFFDKKKFDEFLKDSNKKNRLKKLFVFEITEESVYRLDSYREDLKENNTKYKTYSKIISKGYKFCTRYIQTNQIRTYTYDLDKSTIKQIEGCVKKDQKIIDGKELKPVGKGVVLYNNFDEGYKNSNPVKVMKNSFNFECSIYPSEESFKFTQIVVDGKTYAAKIPDKILTVNYESNKLLRTANKIQILSDKEKIDINPSVVLGYSFEELGKYFFDVSAILKKNFMKEKYVEKPNDHNYYFYKKLPSDVELFYDDNEKRSFIIPEGTVLTKNVINTTMNKNYTDFGIKYVPIFYEDNIFSNSKKFCKFVKEPTVIYLNNKGFNKNSKQLIVEEFYKQYFNTFAEFEYIDNEPVDGFKGVLLQNIKKSFYFTVKTDNDVYNSLTEYVFNDDIPNFEIFEIDPTRSSKVFTKTIYIPSNTVLTILDKKVYGKTLLYHAKIKQTPVFVTSDNINIQRFECDSSLFSENIDKSYILNDSKELQLLKNENKELYSELKSFGVIERHYLFFKEINNVHKIGLQIPFALKIKYQNMYCNEILSVEENNNLIINKYSKINLFTKNPLFVYPKSVDKEQIKSDLENNVIQNIRNITLKADKEKESYSPITIKSNKIKHELLLIKQKEVKKCRDNAQEWKKFFTICKENTNINMSVNAFLALPDFTSEEEKKVKNFINNKADNKIYSLFTELTDGREEIMKKIHNLNVTHLHELDFKSYSDKTGEEKSKIKKEIENYGLLTEIGNPNIFTSAEIDFTKNLMTFVHPVYFYNHLKTAGMLEFNPYFGKKIPYYDSPENRKNSKISYCEVVDNPGFAPLHSKWDEYYEYEGKKYAITTGLYNEDYTESHPKYDYFYHEGVDFRAKEGTPVISFIHAKVIAYGWLKNWENKYTDYGKTVWLYNIDGPGVYLLAHLSKFPDDIYVGKEYGCGDVVAYTGTTGANSDGTKNETRWVEHLHLSYYDYNYDPVKDSLIVNCGTDCVYNKTDKILPKRNNPFNHKDDPKKENKLK